jgi:Spy/CpxP family protein refolding chaperone
MQKLVFIIVALFLWTNPIFSQPEDMAKPKRNMAHNLELSTEQESKISDLQLKFKKEIIPLDSEIDQLRSDINLELTSDNFSESKIKKLTEDISRLQKDLEFKRILHQRAIRDLLTVEQKKKFDLHLLSQREFRGRERSGFQHRSYHSPDGPPEKEF